MSISNQEDLSISNYSYIGCLMLNPDKQFMFNHIQENSLLPYQTLSSSNLTIELCFRLCRRWIILMNHNHTICICLYTMNELYEFHEHLGDVLPVQNCTANALEIYSLTKDPYLLPPPSPNDDWSFEGCYYLHGIQTYHANRLLNDTNYTQAIDLCRKHCQTIRSPTYFSFFLSLKKFCYCLPIKLSPSIATIAVRKPLIHCSFLSYLKDGFETSLNDSEINSDTVVKINVQRYCSSSFIFDRNLYLCLKIVLLDRFNTYSKISPDKRCSPVLIKTYEQWNHLISFSYLLRSRSFIWIDRNSTYIFDKFKVNSSISTDLCLIVNQTRSLLFDLIPCSTAQSPGYVFCAQKPLETVASDEADFKSISELPIVNNLSCPTDFVLFNNICYYVDTSFVYNIKHGAQLCSDKYLNSSLVKFPSHEWGNINSTRFLGRTFDDILLEFFYYQIEKKLIIETKNNTNKKHWLRLLIGDQNKQNECVLRYFDRLLGAFTVLHRCSNGGHPICQCQPISINETKNQSLPIPIERICENCTNSIADEDLINNETNTEYIDDQNNTLIQIEKPRWNYRPLLMLVTGPLFALIILLIGIVFLIRYVRRNHGSYSTHSTIIPSLRRTKRSSTTTTFNDTSNTPAVLYTRLTSSPPSIIIDDLVQLLPQSINHTNIHENMIPEDVEEPLYATLKLPNQK